MSKVIAIWGSPNSGKTSFAVKLANAVYDSFSATVIVVCPDMTTPGLPVLFPGAKSEDLCSLGTALSKAEITQDEIVKAIATVKSKQNMGFLGFCDGENKYTYPAYDEQKATELLDILKTLAQVIIVDCSSLLTDTLSAVAVKNADEVICLATPDLKCISYFSSQLPLFADLKTDRHIQGINVIENDCYMPVQDAKTHFKEVSFVLPYCHEIRQQALDGTLTKPVSDKKYTRKMTAIAENLLK